MPYAIYENRNVRVIPYSEMPVRLTGNENLAYYDVVNFARIIQSPGFYTWDSTTKHVHRLLFILPTMKSKLSKKSLSYPKLDIGPLLSMGRK